MSNKTKNNEKSEKHTEESNKRSSLGKVIWDPKLNRIRLLSDTEDRIENCVLKEDLTHF